MLKILKITMQLILMLLVITVPIPVIIQIGYFRIFQVATALKAPPIKLPILMICNSYRKLPINGTNTIFKLQISMLQPLPAGMAALVFPQLVVVHLSPAPMTVMIKPLMAYILIVLVKILLDCLVIRTMLPSRTWE